MKLFSLEIITQDTVIYQDTAESVTAPASEGEITILAHHAPLFTMLNPGRIIVRKAGKETEIVTGSGFVDVSPQNRVTVLVDRASRAEDIDIREAEAAKHRAEELLSQRDKFSRTEVIRAEASLRKAVLELRVARSKRRHHPIFSHPSES